jgi:site-specific DNA-methyltransferase (adenine-specific)
MSDISIITSDARDLPLPDNSVQLIITDPPYEGTQWTAYSDNPGKTISKYSDYKEFEENLVNSFKEMYRVLKDDGSIFYFTGWSLRSYDPFFLGTTHLSATARIIEECGFKLLSSIIWKDGHTPDLEPPFGIIKNNTQIIYHLSKSTDIKFVPYYFSKYNFPIWECPIELQENFGQDPIWMIPDEICSRLIKMYTSPEDVVLDPFGGSGTVAIVAKNLGRKGISIDCIEEQSNVAKKRSEIKYIA